MKKYYPEGRFSEAGAGRRKIHTPASLIEAAANGSILEATVLICDSRHDLIVDLGCMRGIIPRNEGAVGIGDGSVKDIALISRVGKPVCFRVTAVKSDASGGFYAILSRKSAQELCYADYVSELRPGDVVDARVTHIENFGAFCDIGCGFIALLPIDAMSVSRISHPSDRLTVGEDIKAVVRTVDDLGRITLTLKELLGTWEENAAGFSPGQTVPGIVRSVTDYGIFVELTPNLAGLAEVKENVSPGQRAGVYIKNLIPEKMKVKLIIIDTFCADYSPSKLKYYIESPHIGRWRYSPLECPKIVESEFDG